MIGFQGQAVHLLLCQTFCSISVFNAVSLIQINPGKFMPCDGGNTCDWLMQARHQELIYGPLDFCLLCILYIAQS